MTSKANSLILACAVDRHGDCCDDQRCTVCGAHVSTYNCNETVVALRPEAAHEDWWAACDNGECVHSYGEGIFQISPDWIVDNRAETA